MRVTHQNNPFFERAPQLNVGTPTACKHMVSGTVSLAFSAFFSPFPHGTGSLSVIRSYLALPDGAGWFMQGFTGPALLRIPAHRLRVHLQACHLLWGCFPGSFDFTSPVFCRSYNPPTGKPVGVWADSRSLAATWEITSCFLLLPLLRCFSSGGLPPS